MDYDEDLGEDFGPVLIVHDPSKPPEGGEWMARSQAKQLAERLAYPLDVNMTDEELEAFKRDHSYPPGTRAVDMTREQLDEFRRRHGLA
jgi:hypothetical protein